MRCSKNDSDTTAVLGSRNIANSQNGIKILEDRLLTPVVLPVPKFSGEMSFLCKNYRRLWKSWVEYGNYITVVMQNLILKLLHIPLTLTKQQRGTVCAV